MSPKDPEKHQTMRISRWLSSSIHNRKFSSTPEGKPSVVGHCDHLLFRTTLDSHTASSVNTSQQHQGQDQQ